ncbi:unnamed protein product [Calicophoron daubneyi]|uniref:VLRF1 domain-containing protein n=1 Tax=Calicophoron daubneyi TaxID=300641 RepID=A0AAV2SZW3_CALDB
MASNAGIIGRQCKRTCDKFSLFDQKIAVEKLTGLTLLAECVGSEKCSPSEKNESVLSTSHVSSLDKFTCQMCSVDLKDTVEMRKHFKSDWHIHNMNLILAGQLAVSSEHYKRLMIDCSDAAIHTSGQDGLDQGMKPPQEDDIDDMNVPSINASSHKQMVYFRNKCAEIIGIHRCVLFTRKTLPATMDELLMSVTRARQSRRWAVLLYSGGKFAGGIFDGPNEVVHKTLQRYTVRAKQGGGQTSHDAATGSGMGAAKSGGASLRRYGEAAIRAEISDLLHNRWRQQLQSCQYIFLWSPKVHRNIFFIPPATTLPAASYNTPSASDDPFFAGKNQEYVTPDPASHAACQVGLGMTSDDVRIRRIPCRNKQITYTHVKEIHKELSTFDVYDSYADIDFVSQSVRKQLMSLNESGEETLLETRSGRLIYGPLKLIQTRRNDQFSTSEDDSTSSPETSAHFLEKETTELTTSCPNLTADKVDEPHSYEQKTTLETPVTEIEHLYSSHSNWHRRLRVAIASGDLVTLQSLLPSDILTCASHDSDSPEVDPSTVSNRPDVHPSDTRQASDNRAVPSREICIRLMNHPLAEGRSLLHVAVEVQNDPEILNLLLECGCDPTQRDSSGVTPYNLAMALRKKNLASVFRRFRFQYPERYDYEKAEIPSALDPTKEAIKTLKERERQQKQRQRTKERRAMERAQLEKEREEAVERERFLTLSDREKRALMAEKRALAVQDSQGRIQQVFSRCYGCGCDISGKVPFTYNDFNFCTTACLRNHRTHKTSSLKTG